jgi:hypothetical protein
MEAALFIIRHLRTAVWLLVLLWLAGSLWRSMLHRTPRHLDSV